MSETLWISWSRLRAHMECHQKGYLQRSGKGKMANQRVFFPGTVTDRVVRDWLLKEPEQNPGLMPSMVEEIVKRETSIIEEEGKRLIWKDKGDRDFVIRECITAVTKIEPALNKYVLPFDYNVDFRFKAPLLAPHPNGGKQQIMLNGAMDIIVRDSQGRYAIWDVKHTVDNNYWKKTRGQLSFYDLCTLIMFGQPTVLAGLLQPLCAEPVKPLPLTTQDRDSLMQHVLSYTNDILREDFTPTDDTNECHWCDVKHACSKFKPVKAGTTQKFSLI